MILSAPVSSSKLTFFSLTFNGTVTSQSRSTSFSLLMVPTISSSLNDFVLNSIAWVTFTFRQFLFVRDRSFSACLLDVAFIVACYVFEFASQRLMILPSTTKTMSLLDREC